MPVASLSLPLFSRLPRKKGGMPATQRVYNSDHIRCCHSSQPSHPVQAIDSEKIETSIVFRVDGVDPDAPGKDYLPGMTSHRKEQGMYVAIRRLKVQPGVFEEVVQRDESGLIPILRSVPGFVEFDLVQVGEDVG